jgi:broad specificity phosphatase PhoE
LSSLYAIRHAQASFDADHYDLLSARGEEQARLLGAYLAADPDHGFDRVICGGMHRHWQTLSAIEGAFEAAGRSLPAARVDVDFNEFDHGAVIEAFLGEFPDHPEYRGQMPQKSDRIGVTRFLSSALQSWANAELEHRLAEGWRAFGLRVARGHERIRAEAQHGDRILLVSSGGVIARLAQAALEVSDRRTIDFNLSLMNSAISQFSWRDDTLRLHSWNTLPHLSQLGQRQLWSHF